MVVEAVAATPLASLTVRPSDVQGFRQVQASYYNNATAARVDRVPLSSFRREGRLRSYNVAFVRPERAGLFKIENVVARFRTAGGARWDYTRVVRQALQRKARRSYRNFRQVKVRTIGWQRVALTYVARGRTSSLLVDSIRFQRGAYRVSLQVIGLVGRVKPAQEWRRLMALARVVDRRVGSAR
jgi:hypothetical protein